MLNHLIELRRRILRIVILFTGLFLLFFCYANNLFQTMVSPLIAVLPVQGTLIATQITSPLLTPVSLAADIALLCTLPFALVQLWLFMAPGLYRHEKQPIFAAMIGSFILFCVGMLFCFFVVLPFMFQFFAEAVPKGVKLMPDMRDAIDFITRMLMLFGLCFQLPLLCLGLVRLGWADLVGLKQARSYVIVGSFVVGMLLTPPDVFSQVMLALPLCLLYETGLLLVAWQSRYLTRKNGIKQSPPYSMVDEK